MGGGFGNRRGEGGRVEAKGVRLVFVSEGLGCASE